MNKTSFLNGIKFSKKFTRAKFFIILGLVIFASILASLYFYGKQLDKRDKYREFNKLSLSYFSKKDFENSLKYANAAIDLNYKDGDDFAASYKQKAISLYKLKKHKESLEFFDKVYSIIKKDSSLKQFGHTNHFFLPYSIAEEMVGNLDKSYQILLDSLEYEGDKYFIYFRLACLEVIYFKNDKKALEYFNKAKKIDPVNFNTDPQELINKLNASKDNYIIYLNKFL
ncbi:MAG: tetratricopeptide (TPR) repeat protein [Rickettsiales bacterium]|jgi:tetratricopeptide (TPR) repeat protein